MRKPDAGSRDGKSLAGVGGAHVLYSILKTTAKLTQHAFDVVDHVVPQLYRGETQTAATYAAFSPDQQFELKRRSLNVQGKTVGPASFLVFPLQWAQKLLGHRKPEYAFDPALQFHITEPLAESRYILFRQLINCIRSHPEFQGWLCRTAIYFRRRNVRKRGPAGFVPPDRDNSRTKSARGGRLEEPCPRPD